ncbi:hypothetical protein BJY52DRAFT_1414397 [Lactarius psammicola]|nr:hypothetical protein BJY52DRAFT_1414397 [Lactarius psammicola]
MFLRVGVNQCMVNGWVTGSARISNRLRLGRERLACDVYLVIHVSCRGELSCTQRLTSKTPPFSTSMVALPWFPVVTDVYLMIARGLAANGAKVLPFDVSDRDSIAEVKNIIEEKDAASSARTGIAGPVSLLLNDPGAPQNAYAETLGSALFNDDDPDPWPVLNKINMYYMTTAFLGSLDKGSRDIEGYTCQHHKYKWAR